MEIDEAKKILNEHAQKRINEINNLEMGVARFYYDEKRSLEKLLEILEYTI